MAARKYIPVGTRFGRLIVVADDEPIRAAANGALKHFYIVKCDCGTVQRTSHRRLTHENIRSCGCLRKDVITKHGSYKSPTWRSWNSMTDRCRNPQTTHWERYGGRGIKVCERWKDFANFLADMGERPDGTTLDRIDNDGDYEPGNCRWATKKEQSANRRNTAFVVTSIGRMTTSQLAAATGLHLDTIRSRLFHGWVGDELLLPRHARRRQIASLPQGACVKEAP